MHLKLNALLKAKFTRNMSSVAKLAILQVTKIILYLVLSHFMATLTMLTL